MKTVLFGGTTEGREISKLLADMGAEVIVSVVSEYGASRQVEHEGITVVTGPRTAEEMKDMVADADVVIDATHPFAMEASANISRACEEAKVRRIRLLREEDEVEGDNGDEDPASLRAAIFVDDRAEAASAAGGKGNVLLTTGVRDLPFYCEKLGTCGTYARVLPSKESIEACLDSGMDRANIIAMQGPFSQEMNEALIRQFDIGVMITKDSGRSGGFMEKIRACKSCGITAVVIRRPEESGMDRDEVIEECRKLMERES